MPIDETLARVDAEIAAGDLAAILRARQRLRGLVSTYPTRLDLRERLAEVYRLLGDPTQAGRWTYLSDRSDPTEIAAFERAYPDPIRRMRALSWPDEPENAPTATARARLKHLRAHAHPTAERPHSDLGCLLVFWFCVLWVAVFFAIGVITAVGWINPWR